MRYVALLRGINVGGNTMIKMSELKKTFESLGFENVVTYINSGNLGFDCRKTDENNLAEKISKAVERDFGKPVAVMIRSQDSVKDLLGRNPFEGQFESHKEMHVLFLTTELSSEQEEWLSNAIPKGERFAAEGREIFCHLPMGVADSYLGRGQFEKKLKISVTARNWRTVEKLGEL